jgi:hypothetical protein
VKLSRLRTGEWIALAAAVALIVLLAMDWFFLSTPDARVGAHESGIRSLGWFAELLVVGAILVTLAAVVATATQHSPAWPVVLGVLSLGFGVLAVLTIAFRLIFQPSLGVDAPNPDVEVELPAYLGLLAAMVMTYGSWRAMTDERLDAPESIEQSEEVLRVRGAPRPAPHRS